MDIKNVENKARMKGIRIFKVLRGASGAKGTHDEHMLLEGGTMHQQHSNTCRQEYGATRSLRNAPNPSTVHTPSIKEC